VLLGGVETAVSRDTQDPSSQRRAPPKTPQIAIDLDEHLLANLVGQLAAVRDGVGEAIYLHAIAIHHHGESAPHIVGAQRGSNITIVMERSPDGITCVFHIAMPIRRHPPLLGLQKSTLTQTPTVPPWWRQVVHQASDVPPGQSAACIRIGQLTLVESRSSIFVAAPWIAAALAKRRASE
jgi:hypothetical protein